MFYNNPRRRLRGSDIWFRDCCNPLGTMWKIALKMAVALLFEFSLETLYDNFLCLCSLGSLIYNFSLLYCFSSCLNARAKLCKNSLIAFISILWNSLKRINVDLPLKVWCSSVVYPTELLTKRRISSLLLVINLFKLLISSWLTYSFIHI